MKGDNLQELVEFIAQSLVDQPTKVDVNKRQRGKSVQLELHVSQTGYGPGDRKERSRGEFHQNAAQGGCHSEGNRVNLDIVEPY